jgi:hypothetical protein
MSPTKILYPAFLSTAVTGELLELGVKFCTEMINLITVMTILLKVGSM